MRYIGKTQWFVTLTLYDIISDGERWDVIFGMFEVRKK